MFSTTAAQKIRLAEIVVEMNRQGIPRDFIAAVDELARVDAGVFELADMWFEGEDRDECLADLQDLVDEAEELPRAPAAKPSIPFDELDDVGDRVVQFKKRLRDIVDRQGGVSAVAKKVGMPQPSLSRLLNSASMPRRTTLYRIANALGVPEAEIVTDWIA